MPMMRTTPTPNSVAQFGCPHRQVSTVDIEACQVFAKLRLNARFNKIVTALWPTLDRKSKRELANGQRFWNRYVESECDIADRAFIGGTIRGVIAGECYVDLTRARVQEVQQRLWEHCGDSRKGLCARK